MKKIISMLLVFCMLLTAFPVFATIDASHPPLSTEKLEGEIIIPVTKTEGEWKDSKAIANYDGGKHTYTNVDGGMATYTIEKVKAGNYEIYYWAMPHEKNSYKNPVVINHNGKTTELSIDLKLKVGVEFAPGWMSLGVYDIAAKGDESVTMTCVGNNVRSSAIKLVPTDKPLSSEAPKVETPVEEKKGLERSVTDDMTGYCIWTNGDGDEPWRPSTAVLGPMTKSPQSMWISGVDERATMTYYPEISEAGDVEVSVFLLWWKSGQNPKVKYEIHHNGKVDEKILDPTTITESQWVSLGTFDFAGNPETEFVRLVVVPPENYKESTLNTRASTISFKLASGKLLYVTPDEKRDAAASNCAPLNTFADMKDHWAHYDVEYMANEKLVAGKGEGKFDPDAQITRAEYVTILDRAMGYELITGESYPDVPDDSWYATYVATAKANGLLNGLPTDDGFKPDTPITREDMALFTYNAIKATKKNDEWVKKLPTNFAEFTDTAEISDYAKEALQYLIQTGIIKGMTDTLVVPKGNATRAQGAVILKRFMQSFVWAGPDANKDWVLTFSDEFFGDSLDWAVWQSDNRSQSNLMGGRWPENAIVKDGALSLVTLRERERKGDKDWSTGSVWVRSTYFAQKYGYWEARYKIADSPYINNAFWTYVNWVNNVHSTGAKDQHFEIDINEGRYPNTVVPTLHNDTLGKRVSTSGKYYSDYDLSQDYHTYGLEWNEDELIYYFDGREIFKVPNENIDELQFPILSSALNLKAEGLPDTEFLETYMEGTAQVIDYVRVWQKPEYAKNPEMTFFGERLEGAGPTDLGYNKEGTTTDGTTTASTTLSPVDNTKYPDEVIIPATVSAGWRSSNAVPNYDGGVHYWTNTAGETATYEVGNLNGKYKVYIWTIPYHTNANPQEVMLKQGDSDTVIGSASYKTDSEADNAKATPGWALLGEVELTGKKGTAFHYTCTGEKLGGAVNVRASAIKLVPVK